MTASTAARRSGVAATGPPSCKTSSTMMTRLRSCTSGMQEAPLRTFDGSWPRQGRNNARTTLEAERRRLDQAFFTQPSCGTQAAFECGVDVKLREQFDAACDEQIAEIGVRRNFVGRDPHDA